MPLILITGVPGIGKTTLIRNLSVELLKRKIGFNGFYTEEIRNHEGQRCGFDIVTFDGKRAPLARVNGPGSNAAAKNNFVGKYAVCVTEFESIALDVLVNRPLGEILLLDEIGKMELKSRKFEENIKRITDGVIREELFLIATIPLKVRLNTVERLKTIQNVRLFHVTLSSRKSIQQDILGVITQTLGNSD
ncbi:nucleoside-triphosphatase THEP1 [Toxorhynchites rutilus septentrionalis]|uniref:nucleoside-triphosphatase THEP1 n=1 Tax=Toxorhynchites rutilus septentrionalis TaxID=329112 RepID=UPI002478F558|nr:nucleoside-triphosphatase THEP1 [Toxorhynchites rutilus septentrionalis]